MSADWWARRVGQGASHPQAPTSSQAPPTAPPVRLRTPDGNSVEIDPSSLQEALAASQPPSDGDPHNYKRKMWGWKGNPRGGLGETLSTGNCPGCGSPNYFSRAQGVTRGPPPSPSCFSCFPPGVEVTLLDGRRQGIESIEIGAQVLTTSGLGTVEETLRRCYHGELVSLTVGGSPVPLKLTPEHPVLVANHSFYVAHGWSAQTRSNRKGLVEPAIFDQWVAAKDVVPGMYVSTTADVHEEPLLVTVRHKRVSSRGTSRFTGVSQHGKTGLWVVFIGRKYRGRFSTEEEAGAFATVEQDKLDIESFKLDAELAYLLGWYVAEGYFYGKTQKVGFSLHQKEVTVAKELGEIVVRRLGASSSGFFTPKKGTLGATYTVSSWRLRQMCEQLVGHGAKDKVLSSAVMCAPLDVQQALVRGWRDGDGHLVEKGYRRSSSSSISTASKDLADQLVALLARLGYPASVGHCDDNYGGGFVKNCSRLYTVGWNDLQQRGHPARLFAEGRAWHWVTNVSTEPYNGLVYNLSVSGDHTYHANGIGVHNCGYPLVQTGSPMGAGAGVRAQGASHRAVQTGYVETPQGSISYRRN